MMPARPASRGLHGTCALTAVYDMQDDPVKFVEDGGWDFLDLEKSDDEDEESEESEGAWLACNFNGSCASAVLTADAFAGYVPTDGEGSGEEEEVCKSLGSLFQFSMAAAHCIMPYAGIVRGGKRR